MAALAEFSLSPWPVDSKISFASGVTGMSAMSPRWRSNSPTDGARQKQPKLTSVSGLMANFLSLQPAKLARN
eukprot:9559520-Heterocapsa_arctica.AAC.1